MDITRIYLVTNCYGDPNKVYIGKTINDRRIYNHKNTFGKDIIFTYIDEVESFDKKYWKPLESFWIEYFRQLGFDTQNKNKGGGGCSNYSDEIKIKMRKPRTQFKKFTLNNKPVLQYDLEGNFIKEWDSMTRASNETGSNDITACCKEIINRSGNFIWRYKSQPLSKNYQKPHHGRIIPVIQYDLDGNLIKEWTYLIENFTKMEIKNIHSVCNMKTKTAYNFIWRFKNNPLPDNYILSKFDNNRKEIIQYDLNGKFIQEWSSITKASIDLKINNTDISDCCLKKQKTSHNFIFRYKNDPLPENYELPKFKGVPVIQFDLENNFIKRWDRIIDVGLEGYSIGSVIACCKGRQKTACKYKWKYEIFE